MKNLSNCFDIFFFFEPRFYHFSGASSSGTPSPQTSSSAAGSSQNSPGKYSELLAVIEELGKDIRPTYAGSKNAAERLKKGGPSLLAVGVQATQYCSVVEFKNCNR